MSQHSSEPKICPNCGYPAVENYCAQCGQEVHLHKDTFGALVMHFAGHYLHYDSKFWQTLRALWFSPGLLTTAYWEEKRMRYIPPISLYIFVSFIYFFTGSLVGHKDEESKQEVKNAIIGKQVAVGHDSVSNKGNQGKQVVVGHDSMSRKDTQLNKSAGIQAQKKTKNQIKFGYNPSWDDAAKSNYSVTTNDGKPVSSESSATLEPALDSFDAYCGFHFFNYAKIKKHHPDVWGYIKEEVGHLFPKIFFFLIPCMALMLKLLFFRRKDLFYVNHVIFSLHYHALWFSIHWLEEIYPFHKFSGLVGIAIFVCTIVYMVKALKNVYQIKTLRSLLYTLLIAMSYGIFMLIGLVGLGCFIIAMG